MNKTVYASGVLCIIVICIMHYAYYKMIWFAYEIIGPLIRHVPTELPTQDNVSFSVPKICISNGFIHGTVNSLVIEHMFTIIHAH